MIWKWVANKVLKKWVKGKLDFCFKKAASSEHICFVSMVVFYSTAEHIKNLKLCEMA